MEASLSIVSALAGLFFGLLFLRDVAYQMISMQCSRRQLAAAAVKLVIALILLHFHFELDILD